jgi:hypothetical protein
LGRWSRWRGCFFDTRSHYRDYREKRLLTTALDKHDNFQKLSDFAKNRHPGVNWVADHDGGVVFSIRGHITEITAKKY